MPLKTTVLGSYPKPSYLPHPDWFRSGKTSDYSIKDYNDTVADTKNMEKLCEKALKEVVDAQVNLGLSEITDGEILRETYFLHFCRHMEGFDFINTVRKPIRGGADFIDTPVIRGKIRHKELFAYKEWEQAQALSSVPVKYTLPGPMTILNSTTNDFYNNIEEASQDLLEALNQEILALVEAGCTNIQLDEPVLVRDTDMALDFGIKHDERCFKGVPDHVTKTIHLCCGYPQYLDQVGYAKADPKAYFTVAPHLDHSVFDRISIEDAHRRNDLELFKLFTKKTVVVGAVQIACSRVESVDEIRERVKEILTVLPKDRLVLAPDCGLGYLTNESVRRQKIQNYVQVAKEF